MSTLSSLTKHVTCQLCSRPYVDPRILPCLHSFCQPCLQKEVDTPTGAASLSIDCPTCQRNIDIPQGEVCLLPQNLHLAFEVEVAGYVLKMADPLGVACSFCTRGCRSQAVGFCATCRKFLCEAAHDSHRRVPQLSSHRVIGVDPESLGSLPSLVRPDLYCCLEPNHGREELRFFCEACGTLVCRDCILVAHKDHAITEVATIANGHREGMRKALGEAQRSVSTMARITEANKRMTRDLQTSKESAELAIEQAFGALRETLEGRRRTLLSDLQAIFDSKMALLADQKRCHRGMVNEIGRYTEAIVSTLKTHTDHEVVALGTLLPTELKVTLDDAEHFPIIPTEHCNIAVSLPTKDLDHSFSTFGCISDVSPSIADSIWTSDPVPRCNREYHITLCTKTLKGEDYKYGGLLVRVELQPTPDSPAVVGQVTDQGDGTYAITITPLTTGPHLLSITMNHMHVSRSPCELDIRPKRDYHTLYCAQHVINISGPYCIAIHNSGDFYVANSSHSVCVFDPSGHLKNTIGGFGTGNARFQYPYGIAIKGDILYVADYGNHCIHTITAQGEFVNKFGQKGSGPGQLNGPMAIAIDSKDRLIVSERHNHRVQILSQSGSPLLIIDGKIHGEWTFQAPWGVALDPLENIHIAACGSNTIIVFAPEGRYIRKYGNIRGPIGVAIDDQGYCLVTEGSGNSLAIFDPQGENVRTVGNFRWPWGISLKLEGDGCVYIANNGTNTIVKYSL